VKKRLDVVLVERGLAESRSQAQALVLAGLVPGYEKPGQQVDEGAALRVERPPRFVSRGGEKLANALAAFAVAGVLARPLEVDRLAVAIVYLSGWVIFYAAFWWVRRPRGRRWEPL